MLGDTGEGVCDGEHDDVELAAILVCDGSYEGAENGGRAETGNEQLADLLLAIAVFGVQGIDIGALQPVGCYGEEVDEEIVRLEGAEFGGAGWRGLGGFGVGRVVEVILREADDNADGGEDGEDDDIHGVVVGMRVEGKSARWIAMERWGKKDGGAQRAQGCVLLSKVVSAGLDWNG